MAHYCERLISLPCSFIVTQRFTAVVAALMSSVALAAPPREEAVEFDGGASDVRLAGTLLLPADATADAAVAGVVLITGSGPQDRDETIMGKKPHKVLAEALVARGYAVLRFDDRGAKALGIGQSTGSYAGSTLADFSKDSAAALRFLAARPEVDDARIAVCGHSTGGLEVAMLLAEPSAAPALPAAAILLAAPTVQGAKLLAHQTEEILKTTHARGGSGMTEEQLQRACAVQTELVMAYVSDDAQRLSKAAEEGVRFSLSVRSPTVVLTDQQLAAGAQQAIAPMRDPWMDHFLRYDPAPHLTQSRIPVLAVFGGKDLQVAPAINAQPATDSLARSGQKLSAVITLPTCNHLFQDATSGLPAEYGSLPGEMNPRLCEMLAAWLDRALAPAAPAGAN